NEMNKYDLVFIQKTDGESLTEAESKIIEQKLGTDDCYEVQFDSDVICFVPMDNMEEIGDIFDDLNESFLSTVIYEEDDEKEEFEFGGKRIWFFKRG
ncbi:MAG: hypothetical protein IJI66_05230, partial [Erysipelotrichaceae bacterium]|nr:hypothetical protein [Erysipelotrichaceae bacterium]